MSEIQLLASSYMAIIYVATVVVNLVSNEENAILMIVNQWCVVDHDCVTVRRPVPVPFPVL